VLRPSADPIAAIATAQGRGGVGVVRLSGVDLQPFIQGIIGAPLAPRHATYTTFLDAAGVPLDQGIVLYFPAPHSYTGEAVLELQGHGGPAILQLVLQRCLALGARLAEPGEFTLRAYLNEKIDLAQAESVADLIEANTAEGARSAVRTLRGDFSAAVQRLVEQLVALRMLVEAMLDFPEEDLGAEDVHLRSDLLQQLARQIGQTLATATQGNLLREGAYVVIAGQPNVGKSSLLNRLAGEEVALVTNIPGTTRDVLRQAIQIHGVPLHILDTAGLRETGDEVEQLGIARARDTLHRADLILFLQDASAGTMPEDEQILQTFPAGIPVLRIHNKADLLQTPRSNRNDALYISTVSGEGLESLRQAILKQLGWRDQESGVFMARERHLQGLRRAQQHVANAQAPGLSAEFLAEELRLAQSALNEITGEFTADDLLGEIFSRFCIGK
jgi:tRNA modification GTPase